MTPAPILIIASAAFASSMAVRLQQELAHPVEIAPSRRAGLAALRREEYALVLFEEELASGEQQLAQSIYQKALATPVLEVRFSADGEQRILRQVRAALERRAQDQAHARKAAATALQNELKSSLTGLLLESQLALRDALPSQAEKLRLVVRLADELRSRLSV